tara:strand:+ start:24247 stop:24600 length:354 start_codon:yes stop_codon:yes gene_type:complete
MSDLKDQIDIDIKRFLDNIENQSQDDKIKSLRTLFDKHLHLHTCDYMMDKHDLQTIIGGAKTLFARETVPIHLGEKKRMVEQSELSNLFVIEATVSHLNKNDCLKRLPKFDKRENKF